MPAKDAKEHEACLSCGLSTNAKMKEHGVTVKALRPKEDCPVCKRRVKVDVLPPGRKIHFTIAKAKAAKKKEEEDRHGGREYEGVGSKVLSRAEVRSPGLEPYEWDNAA